MKYKKLGHFSFGGGWYKGEEFKLFELIVFGLWQGGATLFSVQVAKLSFWISYHGSAK